MGIRRENNPHCRVGRRFWIKASREGQYLAPTTIEFPCGDVYKRHTWTKRGIEYRMESKDQSRPRTEKHWDSQDETDRVAKRIRDLWAM